MANLTQTLIKDLSASKSANSVSIFFPTHTKGAEVIAGADRNQLKNQLNEAKEILIQEKGFGKKEAEEYLAPAFELLEDKVFWHYMGEGFALFLNEEGMRYYTLPLPVKHFTYVADQFYLLPLLPMFSGDGKFFLLSLSLNQTRLFTCTKNSFQEIHIKTGMPVAVGETAPALKAHFSGHGDRLDDRKTEIEVFLNDLDKKIFTVLHGEDAPMVIASVEYLHPIYEKVSNYKYLHPDFIRQNPDHESPESLHQKAWELVKGSFDRNRKSELEKFQASLAKGLATTNITEILQNADSGRIEALFANTAENGCIWASVGSDGGFEIHAERKAGDTDLLNKAAVEVFFHGGKVFATGEEINENAAAVYRF